MFSTRTGRFLLTWTGEDSRLLRPSRDSCIGCLADRSVSTPHQHHYLFTLQRLCTYSSYTVSHTVSFTVQNNVSAVCFHIHLLKRGLSVFTSNLSYLNPPVHKHENRLSVKLGNICRSGIREFLVRQSVLLWKKHARQIIIPHIFICPEQSTRSTGSTVFFRGPIPIISN